MLPTCTHSASSTPRGKTWSWHRTWTGRSNGVIGKSASGSRACTGLPVSLQVKLQEAATCARAPFDRPGLTLATVQSTTWREPAGRVHGAQPLAITCLLAPKLAENRFCDLVLQQLHLCHARRSKQWYRRTSYRSWSSSRPTRITPK